MNVDYLYCNYLNQRSESLKNKISLRFEDIVDIKNILEDLPHDSLIDVIESENNGIGSTITLEFPYKIGSLDGRYSLVIRGPESW